MAHISLLAKAIHFYVIQFCVLLLADLQKSLVARQQLDSQLNENKLVLDVRLLAL